MSRTFEEFTAGEIDGLYHGALFLTGGDTGEAEDLLLLTLTGAFRASRGGEVDSASTRRLEGRLARDFLSTSAVVSAGPFLERVSASRVAPGRNGGKVTAEVLHKAAGELPETARVALWLVLFRRWSYAEAANILEVDREGIRALLLYRQVLLSAVLGEMGRRTGTDGTVV